MPHGGDAVRMLRGCIEVEIMSNPYHEDLVRSVVRVFDG